jgi:hypothetical protein
LHGVAVKVVSVSHHDLLKFNDLKNQICEAIASVEGTLQNFWTSSFIALSPELPLELIFSIYEDKKHFSSTVSIDAIVTLVELVIRFTKC